MLSRRELGGKVAAGAAVVLATGMARGSVTAAPQSTDAAATGDTPRLATDSTELPADSEMSIAPDSPKEFDCGATDTAEVEAPWDLLRPLTVGSAVGSGWKIAGLSGAIEGSYVITLENERGRQSRVHVCRNDGNPQGLVYTKHFDLVVMNGGIGDLATEESLSQAVADLAHTLARNESDRRIAVPIVASLLPHGERVRLAQGATDRRLR